MREILRDDADNHSQPFNYQHAQQRFTARGWTVSIRRAIEIGLRVVLGTIGCLRCWGSTLSKASSLGRISIRYSAAVPALPIQFSL
jgi:hypothetical protein